MDGNQLLLGVDGNVTIKDTPSKGGKRKGCLSVCRGRYMCVGRGSKKNNIHFSKTRKSAQI